MYYCGFVGFDESPEQQRIRGSIDRSLIAEKVKLVAMERHEHEKESEKWKAELARRQEEIQAAREASEALRQKTEQERKARELLSQRLTEIESRGLIARLFNRQPKSATAG